jgi:hypothetical protein
MVRDKRRPLPHQSFFRNVDHVVLKFGPLSMAQLEILWKGDRKSLTKLLEKKKKFFRVRDSKYSLSKYGRKKLGA